MVKIYRFAAVRPERSTAKTIAAVPYDVVTTDEVRTIITKNPRSFLRVSRSDVELPNIPSNDDRVYQRARDNFLQLLKDRCMHRDSTMAMYIYRVIQNDEIFVGLCCCLDVNDYRTNHIRKHEQTQCDKEEDRTRHIEITKTHNGPVVLLYRDTDGIFSFIESLVPMNMVPDLEVRTDSSALHQIFRISDEQTLKHLEILFNQVPLLYIADGHHRAKSAVNVADKYSRKNYSNEINRFMGVIFPHNKVKIHGYSRLITDFGNYTEDTFLEQLQRYFDVKPYGPIDSSILVIPPKIANSSQYHVLHMYLSGQWYECTQPKEQGAKFIEELDVAVLQRHVLEGILGITDPRIDSRLQYFGGVVPINDVAHLVDNGNYVLAFTLQPMEVDTVLRIADENGVMPPKSTWFEPKLLSGLLVHTFE